MTIPESIIEYRIIQNHPLYRVGNDGTVWSRAKKVGLGRHLGCKIVQGTEWHLLKSSVDKYGRCVVNLRRGNRRYVHHLVLEAFVGKCPEGLECCHEDGNPLNNNLKNLRSDTSKANTEDQRRIGTLIGGEKHGNSKLTNKQVDEIRRLKGLMRQWEIAELYRVTQSTVSVIHNDKSRTPGSHAGRGLNG